MTSSTHLTLEALCKSRHSKFILWKTSKFNDAYRFSPAMMSFLRAYLKEMEKQHSKGTCLDLGEKIPKCVAFKGNMYDQVMIMKKEVQQGSAAEKEKEKDFVDLANFIEDEIANWNLGAYPLEISNFLMLLRDPRRSFPRLGNHYSLWGSEKRNQIIGKLYKELWEDDQTQPHKSSQPQPNPQASQPNSQPSQPTYPPNPNTDLSKKASFFKNDNLMNLYTQGSNFWEVWDSSTNKLLAESYGYALNQKRQKLPFNNNLGGAVEDG